MSESTHELLFEIGDLIGFGGQADVHVARLRATGGIYAAKFLREGWDPFARDGFRREAMRQWRIAGEHVVRIIAWNLDAERPFIVLEYMPSGSLADEIKRRGRLTVAEALDEAGQIALALADLHARSVVHRDLKPGNILRGVDGRLRLNDLGCAATMTFTGCVNAPGFVGTPAYAAPEQLLGVASAKSDIFALGVILYELLTGVPQPRELLAPKLGAIGGNVDVLVARFCAKEARLRPTAVEAATLLDEAARTCAALEPVVVLPRRAPAPSMQTSSDSGSLWSWFLRAAALYGMARLSAGGSKWDPLVERYRGADGRFTTG